MGNGLNMLENKLGKLDKSRWFHTRHEIPCTSKCMACLYLHHVGQCYLYIEHVRMKAPIILHTSQQKVDSLGPTAMRAEVRPPSFRSQVGLWRLVQRFQTTTRLPKSMLDGSRWALRHSKTAKTTWSSHGCGNYGDLRDHNWDICCRNGAKPWQNHDGRWSIGREDRATWQAFLDAQWIPFKVSSQEHIEHTVDGPAKSKSPVHMVVNIPLFIGFLPFYPIIYRLSTILLVVYRMGFGGTLGLDKVDKRNWRGSAAGPRCGWVPKEMDENKAQL